MGSGGAAWVVSSLRFVLASAAAVSAAAVAVRLSVGSQVAEFLDAGVPRVYGSLVAWLTPPYLYLVVNGIIISIVASSRFHKLRPDHSAATAALGAAADVPLPTPSTDPVTSVVNIAPPVEYETKLTEDAVQAPVVTADTLVYYKESTEPVKLEESQNGNESIEEYLSQRKRRDSSPFESPADRPPLSSRFGNRKTIKPNSEGKEALRRVARPRRNETLESTWRTITEGRAVPLARHLKKSDTWDVRGEGVNREEADAAVMRKSETFNDRSTVASVSPASGDGGGRLKREPSLGQDELNRRVEAFIKKFNEEIRLQRQESFKHYMEMINRGSH